MSTAPLQRLLGLLPDHVPNKSGYRATCPNCGTKGSLAFKETPDGTVLIACHKYGARCDTRPILQALGLEFKDLYPPKERVTPSRNRATVQPSGGLTLDEYATRKRLPKAFLVAQGVTEATYCGAPAVRISYKDRIDREISVRFRTAWADDKEQSVSRFRWKVGANIAFYGLWRLDQAIQKGSILIVEGESDCHTCWMHQIPAIGVPGANAFRPEWAAEVNDIERVYLIQEPDQGGDTLLEKIGNTPLAERLHVIRLERHKDPSSLYLADPDRFPQAMEEAFANAIPYAEILRQRKSAQSGEAWELCRPIAELPDILSAFAEDISARGVVGEQRTVRLLYLIFTSRLLGRPLSAVLKGPSSGGKSYSVERVLEYFPETAYLAMTGMSEHALIYDDRPIAHRHLVVYEANGAASENLSYMIRSILSEGRVFYTTVEKGKDGLQPRHILRTGPTGFVTTTTALHLHPENETRMLSIPVTDTREQTARVLLSHAEKTEIPSIDPAWVSFQQWLEGATADVHIPYAPALMGLIPPVAVRLRRDGQALLNLIHTHALMHQQTRDRDPKRRIVATIEDYAAVRALVLDLFSEGVGATVPWDVRETVKAVTDLLQNRPEGEGVRSNEVAAALKLDKATASRRIAKAIGLNYIHNPAPKGKPMCLQLGDPLPDDLLVLPTVEQLRGCTVAPGDTTPPDQPEDSADWAEVA